MKNNGAWTANTTGNGNITIPEGYHNGKGYVSGAGAYNKGVSDADARVNTSSESYKQGYTSGEKNIKPWPKFVRQIAGGSAPWYCWEYFEVENLKTVTIKYKNQAETGRMMYCVTNNDPDVTLATTPSKWALDDMLPNAGTSDFVTTTIDVSQYKYLGLCTDYYYNTIYDIVSVT